MAGFNFEAGRSNNMVAAAERGMVTIGRWAKRFGVSAAAAVAVMRPTEAHHTGTGRRGRSRLTPVIDSGADPSEEQLAAMRDFDRGIEPQVIGWFVRFEKTYSGRYGRKQFVPRLGVFQGNESESRRLKNFAELSAEQFAEAKALEGRRLKPFARNFADIVEE